MKRRDRSAWVIKAIRGARA